MKRTKKLVLNKVTLGKLVLLDDTQLRNVNGGHPTSGVCPSGPDSRDCPTTSHNNC
jgi:hypothetical protein